MQDSSPQAATLWSRLSQALRGYAEQALPPLTATAAGLALIAQFLLDAGRLRSLASLFFAVAAVIFVYVYGRIAVEREPLLERQQSVSCVRWSFVMMAAVLGALAFPRFSGNLFTADGTLLWVGGLIALALSVWRRGPMPHSSGTGRINAQGIRIGWQHLVLLAIMAVGAFYRLYRIGEIPLEMGCDLPHIYNNIRYVLRHEFLIFFPSHPGREGLFFYLAAPVCGLLGLSHTTIKISSALVGVATLPVIYLLGKELFNRRVGLFAAFFLSVSHWHVILTRVGFRACTVPLVLALMWYWMLRGLRTGRRWFYLLAGIALGLGLYTYNAFMIVPFLVIAMVIGLVLAGRWRQLLSHWDGLVLMALAALLVFVPLGRYALDEPAMYGYRAATRITNIESDLPVNMFKTLLDTTRRALLMFNVQGDGVFIANVPQMRELGFFSAVLFVLGLAYLLVRWRRGYNVTVLLSGAVMLLPTILSLAFPHEVPNAIRAIGALPAVVLLPAVAADLIASQVWLRVSQGDPREYQLSLGVDGQPRFALRWRWDWVGRAAMVLLFVVVLVYETYAVYPTYFQDYVSHLPNNNYSISLRMAEEIDRFSDDGESYIKIMPFWYDGNAVRAQLRREDQSWANELPELRTDQAPFVGPPGKFMVILHPDDQASLGTLVVAFPRGIVLKHSDDAGAIAYLTFYGER